MKVIIIEDETRTANELKKMLLTMDSDIEIDAILPTVALAIDWFKQNPMPELIFADIELGDGLSFEIFEQIEVITPVVFCTAFDEYAIRSFDLNSIDYLLKPIDELMLRKSVDKYLRLRQYISQDTQHVQDRQRAIDQIGSSHQKTLLVSFREKIIPVKLQLVVFFNSSSGGVWVKLEDKRSFSLSQTLEQLEKTVDPLLFFRANRQFIINREFIDDIEYYFNRKLIITMKVDPPEKIVISRLKAQSFLKWMER